MRTLHHPDRDQLDLAVILGALSDPTRLLIVARLAGMEEESCSGFDDLAPKSNLSYHYAKLREAGVTRTRLEGTWRFTSLRRDDLEARFPGLLGTIVANARKVNGLG